MTDPRTRGPGSWRRSDAWAIGGLLLVAVAVPAIVGAFAGSIAIPANDDWSFRRIALGLAQTGRFQLDGIAGMTLIGEVILVQPLLWLSGLQPWAFVVAGITFASAATLGAYALARTQLHGGSAALAAASLVFFPGYLAFDTSFMTDVPALAAELACLALGSVAVRGRPVRMAWLLASAMVGIYGFSIREFAVAAPAAVLATALIADRGRGRIWAVAIGAAVSCIVFYLWRLGLPGQLPPVTVAYRGFAQAVQAFSSLALAVAPAVFVAASRWRHHLRRGDLAVGLVAGAVVAVGPLMEWARSHYLAFVILGNPTSPDGALPMRYLAGGRPQLFSHGQWTFLNGLALIATVAVLTLGAGIAGAYLRRTGWSPRRLIDRVGSPAGVLLLFSLAMMAGLALYGAAGRVLFERYVWPLAVPVAVLLLSLPGELEAPRRSRSRRAVDLVMAGAASAYGLVLAVVAVVLLLNAAAFTSARWLAGEQLVRTGIPADRIDAGYEWVGYHATSAGNPWQPFYRAWWPDFVACGVVSSDPASVSGHTLVGTTEYRLRFVAGRHVTLYEYRVSSPECA